MPNNIIINILKSAESSLTSFANEIGMDSNDISQVSKSYNHIKDIIRNKSDEDKIPKLKDTNSFYQIGSYVRGTKIKPLDDFDMFIILHSKNTKYSQVDSFTYKLTSDGDSPLNNFINDQNNVSSISILNSIKTALNESFKSEPTRNQQAICLELPSYNLNIDIVPALAINYSENYLIPKGNRSAYWKLSNPKIDEEIVNNLNKKHNGNIKPAIKIIKYWNKYKFNSSIRSYHVEAMAYHIFSNRYFPIATIHEALRVFFDNIYKYIYICDDPTKLSEPLSSNILRDDATNLYVYLRVTTMKRILSLSCEEIITFLKSNNEDLNV